MVYRFDQAGSLDASRPRPAQVAQMLDLTFGALSDPTRRSIVATLAREPHTIAALAAPLPMSLVAVSKHITVLERAGLLSRTRQGRAQRCTLTAAPLGDAAGWLERYRTFWTTRLDSLEQYLIAEDA
jgi:DNA-binding transcriptional ArsR family regulator